MSTNTQETAQQSAMDIVEVTQVIIRERQTRGRGWWDQLPVAAVLPDQQNDQQRAAAGVGIDRPQHIGRQGGHVCAQFQQFASLLSTRRDSTFVPSASITTQRWWALPASTPAHSSGTATSVIVRIRPPADDLADMSLYRDRFARPHQRSSRRRTLRGQSF